jgi:outer membrane receptor for ferrienterochelin and colicin
MRTHLLLVSAALAALLALAAPTAHAQGTTTAAISGTVVDATGLGLPGATVLAVHVPSGTEYRAATRGDGGYDLRGLRIGGPYTVTVSFIGFQDGVQSDIQLALGQTQTVNVTLAEDNAALGEIEVTAEAAGATISTDRTGASTNVTEEAIEGLPTISRSLADFARLSPLASAQGSSTSVGGRNNRFNNIQIDGATLNDVFGLSASGTPGGQSGTQPVSLDAVEEFNVEVAPFDVRYGNFTGGLVNVVTRSGTNDFRGSVRVLTQNESLVGERVSPVTGAQVPFNNFSDNLYIGTLGGPILRNRLFFFLSGEYAANSRPNDTGLIGSGQANVFNATPETVQQFIDVTQNTYGYNPGGFELISNDRTSAKLLAKIDWNISPAHRFSLRNNYVRAGDDQGNTRSANTFDLSNRYYVFRSTQNSTAAQLNSTFGGRVSNEARLVYTAIRDNRAVDPASQFPSVTVRLGATGGDFLQTGVELSSQANSLDQNLFEFTDNLSYFTGDHTLTLGTSNQVFNFRNLFIQDFYGSYEFSATTLDTDGDGDTESVSAIDAYRLGSPSRYRFSYASPLDIDDQGRLRVAANGTPLRTVAAGNRPEASFTGAQLGLYVQDEWQATDALRLTLGLRADLPVFPDTPTLNPLVSGGTGIDPSGAEVAILPAFREDAYVAAYANSAAAQAGRDTGLSGAALAAYVTANAPLIVDAYRNDPDYAGPRFEDYSDLSTGEVPNGNLLFSPRFGLNYRTTTVGELSLQVRGGTGLFAGRTPYVWISNQYSNTGADFARLDASFANTPAPVGFFSGSPDPATQPVPGVTPGLAPVATSALALTSPDFRFPQVWRSNLGFDQELGGGLVATIEGIYTKTLSDVGFVNLNALQVGTAADGRPLYGTFTGNTAALARVNSRDFIDAILLDNTTRGHEYNVVAQVQRNVPRGFNGSLSYTYGRAFAVNNATSSVAYSNWRFNESADPNDLDELGTADFEVRHRGLGFASYRAEYADRFSSQLGVVLDVRAGEPFSYIYSNDANGDGETSNDLVYVPGELTSDLVFRDVFLTSGNSAQLNAFIRGESGLQDYRGEIVPRNTGRGPAQARLDLEFTQGIETVRGQRVDFEVTLVNLLNAINSEWGVIRFANNQAIPTITSSGYVTAQQVGTSLAGRIVTQDDIGKPIVSFSQDTVNNALTNDRFSTSDLASRWQLRFGLRYSF